MWQRATGIEAEVSVTGLAFTLKRRPFFQHARLTMDVAQPISAITPIGSNPQLTGALYHDTAKLLDAQGQTIAERANARSYFPYGRRLLYWDDLDMAYFANYAFWNYLTYPRLLLNSSIRWAQINDNTLLAEYPRHIPTHSAHQQFIIDPQTGQLQQRRYTAEVVSKVARVANQITAHSRQNGINYPASMVVTPIFGKNKILPSPVMIAITVHSYNLSGI